ncbi:MAG: ABC transporter substrate-binding protein [Cypionkella sp.]
MFRYQLRSRCVLPLALAVSLAGSVAGFAGDLGPVKGEITYTWWGSQSRADKNEQILKLFEAKYPGTTVVRQNSDWAPYWDKLTIQASAGNMPCTLMMQNRWLSTFDSPNVLLPLEKYVDSGDIDVTGIAPSILESGKGPDGHLYFIPSSVFFNGVMFNKTWLDKAGVPVPGINWTWDDMAKMLHDVAPTLPAGVVATHNLAMENDVFVSWIQSHGDKLFTEHGAGFSQENIKGWFDYWEALRKDGLTDSPETMVEESSSLIENSDIANGRAFMTGRPPNRLDAHQKVIDTVLPGDKLAVLANPVGPAGAGWDVGSNGIAIGANCAADELPAAIAWVNFFTQDKEAAAIYASDLGPVTVDTLQQDQIDNPDASASQRAMITMFREVAPDAKPIFWPSKSSGILAASLARNYQAVAFGQITTDEAAAQVIDDLKAIGD